MLKARGVLVVKGRAALLGPKEALVTRPDGQKEKIASDATIIATGSVPLKPPVPGFDLDGVITSDEALNLPKPPKSLVIVGGGVIGIELASVFAPLGADVTIVEALPEILPNIDPEIAAMMRAHLAGAGVKIHVGAGVEEVRREGGLFATTVKSEEKLSLQSEAVLIATGRGPNTRELGLEALGVEMSRARIKVDRAMATNLPGLYAIGDCASPIMLAHVASREGEVAADNAMGREASINYARVPGAVYTNPEIAWVGLSEKEAREKGLNIAVGRFPLDFNGKSLVMGGRGVFKTIIDASSGEVIGVHLMGPRATDIIGQAAVAMTLEARREDLAEVIAAHPTIGEALSESFLDAAGEAVHKI